MRSWYLEGYFDNDVSLKKIALRGFPVVLGRDSSLEYQIDGATISRRHAMIEIVDGELVISDMNSRNGTFINRTKISDLAPIHHGDTLHLGNTELRLIDRNHSQDYANETADPEEQSDETRLISLSSLSEHFPTGIQDLEELIAERQILPVYQPIIRASDLKRTGFELLSRSANCKLPTSPLELYRLAESYSLEVTLSELMRDIGVKVAYEHSLQGELLINTHPSEMQDIDRLLSSIYQLQASYPSITLTLEIHEKAITDDISLLQTLKRELSLRHIKLAFDDFGVGQSRLLEMVEAKPDLIKFDHVLIDGIDTADESRLNLVRHLLALADELDITTLAECVSNHKEFKHCEQMGFAYYQGWHFAKAEAIEYWLRPHS